MTVRVFVPQDTSARSVGADAVAAAMQHAIAALNRDVELVRNGSRGLFWLEPLVEVDVAGTRIAYGPVTAEQVPSLFAARFLDGGEHPLRLGPTEEIPYLRNQDRITFARAGIDDPLDLAAYERMGGLAGLRRALELEPNQIIEEVDSSGLRGRGGAAFPAAIKWRTVADQENETKYVCCNADEGDSGTFADRLLMEADPFCLLEGMAIAGLATGARQGLIYLRSEYPLALAMLMAAIAKMRAAGWLGESVGESGRRFDIEVRRGAGAYICGEESAMLESLEGKRGVVRARPPIPAVAGLFGKPTLVHNVLSLAAIPYILAHGGAAYARFGVGRSRGTQAFQLAGNVRRGGLVEKSFGITLRELVEEFGGGTRSGRPFKAAQVGGPLGGYLDSAMLRLEMDYESLAERGAMLGHGGIVVFDDRVDMAEMAALAFEFCAHESCGKCTPCRIGSVRGAETVRRIMAGEDAATNFALLDDLCDLMTDASLCALGGLTPMPVRSAIRLYRAEIDGRANRGSL